MVISSFILGFMSSALLSMLFCVITGYLPEFLDNIADSITSIRNFVEYYKEFKEETKR